MKITVKHNPQGLSARVNKADFQRKATQVLNTVVKPQIQNAHSKSISLNAAQKAHKNCNGPI